MKKLILVPALMALALVAVPAVASASEPTMVECYGTTYKVKPRHCTLNGDEAHYAQTPLRNIRWRSWGQTRACGTGTYVYNMGYRNPGVRFCLHRPRWGVFTRVSARTGRHYSYLDSNGKRVYHTQTPRHFDAPA